MISPVNAFVTGMANAGSRDTYSWRDGQAPLDQCGQRDTEQAEAPGTTLNLVPSTECVAWFLELVDIIHVMSVNPGFAKHAILPLQSCQIALPRSVLETPERPEPVVAGGGTISETPSPDMSVSIPNAETSGCHASTCAAVSRAQRCGSEPA
jgi:pentose-5-phosphate-3-epimerase